MVQKTAYVTGAASGIGRAVAEMLASKGIQVAMADLNLEGVKAVADHLNSKSSNNSHQNAIPFEVNTSSWESQLETFEKVVQQLGHVDYVYPIAGIGERMSIPNDPKAKGFLKPDLAVLDVDLNGLIYTSSLAIQQMRRQEEDGEGIRGKSMWDVGSPVLVVLLADVMSTVAVVASVCGFYCVPSELR